MSENTGTRRDYATEGANAVPEGLVPGGREEAQFWNGSAGDTALRPARPPGKGSADTGSDKGGPILSDVVEAAGDAIITVNRLGIIESFSRSAERMFGYEAREAVGREITLLVALPDQQENRRLIKDFLQEHRRRAPSIRRQALGCHKNGDIIPVEVTFGEIEPDRLFVAILRDTSEQRKLERLVLRIVEQEKLRVAADLHDTICQELTGIGFLASALERELREAGRPEADRVRMIAHKILESAERTHTVARGMAPAIDRPRGLMVALQRLADGIACLHGIQCRYVCNAPVQIEDADTASHLYYIAQEALRNAIRHSRAGRIEARLLEAGGRIALIVEDDGVGIPEELPREAGFGIKLMRHRSELLQGRLVVERRLGGGTRVICQVPSHKTGVPDGGAAN